MSKIKKCVGKESFQRMNYLYQMSNVLATESNYHTLSSLYTNLAVNISKRTVQRLDIDIKRTICKGCRSILISGITCKVRVKRKQLHLTCSVCNTTKSFKMDSRKKDLLWHQNPAAVIECLNYSVD